MQNRDYLSEWIRTENVYCLSRYYFDIQLTFKQEEIVRTILYKKHKRVAINCYTRYGKTKCVAIAVCLYILFNRDKKIALIAPQEDQTRILRDYISELITICPLLGELVDIERDRSVESLRKEASRKRITFKNGCELRTLSAHGEATRLMGFGADLIIKDESCLISDLANTKIMRMLGDNPESALIEISNPWTRDNKYYEHYTSGEYYTIHVDYRVGLAEGRITQTFLDEMREEYKDTPLFFTVLYESQFPEQPEDALFNHTHILQSINKQFNVEKFKRILSSDIADKGNDKTVILIGRSLNDHYVVQHIYSEAQSENTAIAGRIETYRQEYHLDQIKTDAIGIGVGVLSMLKQNMEHLPVEVIGCHYGEKSKYPERFLNKKAEYYFKLKRLFEEGKISIPNNKDLIKELMKMKWNYSSNGKIRIVDPEDKSPDFADALCYFVWGDASERFYGVA